MSYMHIDNLYKAQEILAFKTCFALEKIHGTSAHVAYRNGVVVLSSGGEKHERFAKLFDVDMLTAHFAEKFTPADTVVIYGEAYGGKQQGMNKTYGVELKFVAFEVKIGDVFLSVPSAAILVSQMNLEFVDFCEIQTTLEAVDAERDKPSTQAVRNGIADPKIREGVVLRPPFEVTLSSGRRVIAKHKREEFAERGSPKLADIDPTKRVIMESAERIADEWVTPMRLAHVLDRLISARDDKEVQMRDTPSVIALMVEDVTREAKGEIIDNLHVRKAIGGRAVTLLKQRLQSVLSAK